MAKATAQSKIRDIMVTRVATIDIDTPLKEIKDIFEKARFHHLPVLDNGNLVGVISDRDVLRAISPFLGTLSERATDAATLNKKAHQIMSRQPITARPDETVKSAADIMLVKRLSCLPVMEKNKLVGILTLKDIVKALVS